MLNIFGKSGEFVLPPQDQLDALDAPTRERFESVKVAYDQMKAADAALAAATLEVAHAVETYDKAEKYQAKNFPPIQFHDLWKANTTHAENLRRMNARVLAPGSLSGSGTSRRV
jgi:hypothetical protein